MQNHFFEKIEIKVLARKEKGPAYNENKSLQ